MRLYSGIDLHSNNCVLTVINEEGLTVYEKRVANDVEVIKRGLQPHREALVGTVVETVSGTKNLEIFLAQTPQ